MRVASCSSDKDWPRFIFQLCQSVTALHFYCQCCHCNNMLEINCFIYSLVRREIYLPCDMLLLSRQYKDCIRNLIQLTNIWNQRKRKQGKSAAPSFCPRRGAIKCTMAVFYLKYFYLKMNALQCLLSSSPEKRARGSVHCWHRQASSVTSPGSTAKRPKLLM